MYLYKKYKISGYAQVLVDRIEHIQFRQIKFRIASFRQHLVYIGESDCITTRISQHLVTKDFDSYKIAVVCEDIKTRKRKERSMIKKYRPILNMIYNKNMN